MINRVALTSKGPYVGVTTFATRYLRDLYSYSYVSMSDVLVEAWIKSVYAHRSNKYRLMTDDPKLTIEDVKANKAFFRRQLQIFGESYDNRLWIDQCLKAVPVEKRVPIVIEKVRTDEQASYLKGAYGFTIVEVEVPYQTRLTQAFASGVDEKALVHAMNAECEQGIDPDLVDVKWVVPSSGTLQDLAHFIAEQA